MVRAFDHSGNFDQAFRDSLSERAENLLLNLRDLDLKAFCLRLIDTMLPEPDWLESVGSYVASTPPSRWKDDDELNFNEKLAALVAKFLRVESVVFRVCRPADCRLAVPRRLNSERRTGARSSREVEHYRRTHRKKLGEKNDSTACRKPARIGLRFIAVDVEAIGENTMTTPGNGDIPVRHILSLSGGKDSTALAIHMRNTRPDLEMEYVFCDTRKELTETYEYLDRVEAYLGEENISSERASRF